MSKKASHITVTDQFCGAGGSSQGAVAAGAEVKLAMNHWKLAIETHNTNFPNTDHDCADISASDPRRYLSTDILITSPECTNQTGANGKAKPQKQFNMFTATKIEAAEERSRATMWDVVRFAEYHLYNCVIVENVVEARKWIMYDAWLNAMYVLGYQHKSVYLNSQHCHPTPQSRDRMYIVFWKKGNKAPDLEYKPIAHCSQCNKDIHSIQSWKKAQVKFGKYKQQYVYCCPNDGAIVEPYYYAAANCIDWTIPGEKIGDKKPALVENTIRRINVGRDKFWNKEPVVSHLPFIIKGEYSSAADNSYVRSINESLLTQSTRQTSGICIPPFMVENKGQSTAREMKSALSTITCSVDHGILAPNKFNSFLSYYNGGSDVCSHITEPAGTFVCTDRLALVQDVAPNIEDCYYRTLKAHEVKLGMAFNKDYVVLGNVKEQVKQLGNAVTPPAMEWPVKQCVNSLN